MNIEQTIGLELSDKLGVTRSVGVADRYGTTVIDDQDLITHLVYKEQSPRT